MLGKLTLTGCLKSVNLECSAGMLLRMEIGELQAMALSTKAGCMRRFYQGWYTWRRNWGRRKQLDASNWMTVQKAGLIVWIDRVILWAGQPFWSAQFLLLRLGLAMG